MKLCENCKKNPVKGSAVFCQECAAKADFDPEFAGTENVTREAFKTVDGIIDDDKIDEQSD